MLAEFKVMFVPVQAIKKYEGDKAPLILNLRVVNFTSQRLYPPENNTTLFIEQESEWVPTFIRSSQW